MQEYQQHMVLESIKDLYLPKENYVKKKIVTNKKGWIHKRSAPTDKDIIKHISGGNNLGVFGGATGTKFIVFDVDARERAKDVTMKLIDVLESEYGINRSRIFVFNSGGKGYHVTLYLDNIIMYDDLQLFYKQVIAMVGENKNVIELRPTEKQAVKLPFCSHYKTGNYAGIVSPLDLSNSSIDEFLFPLKQIVLNDLLKRVAEQEGLIIERGKKLTFDKENAVFLDNVSTNVNLDVYDTEDKAKYMERILRKNSLEFKNTRHNVTFTLATYLKDVYLRNREEVKTIIYNMLCNTSPDMFTTYDRKFFEETTNINVNDVFNKPYYFGGRKKLEIYESEITGLLQLPGRIELKRLGFAFLMHGKRYMKPNGEFYFSYNTIKKYIHINGNQIGKQIEKLVEGNVVEIVRQGVAHAKESERECTIYKTVLENEGKKIELVYNESEPASFESIVSQLIREKDLR
ncbi:bifunctional DNA primase/polymerase, partial [Bacillus cereus]